MTSSTCCFTLSTLLEKPLGPDQIFTNTITEKHFEILWTLKTQVTSDARVSTDLSCSVPNNYYTKSASFCVNAHFIIPGATTIITWRPSVFGLPDGSSTFDSCFQCYYMNWAQSNKVTLKFEVYVFGPIPIIHNDKMRDFSHGELGLTDVVLLVGEEKQKFHVSKAILATHSTYFHTMFFGGFRESGQSEIELKDVDLGTFQQLLEVIYHCPNIHERNVEILLNLNRIYDSQPVNDQCLRFINGNNALPMEEKQRLIEEYFGKC